MYPAPQGSLPPELVHAVLIQMYDSDNSGIIKRGLASCSLTCRYWAALIRPLLFRILTLRSGKDVSQLIAFLDADLRVPTLRSCIEELDVVEDHVSARPPWSHQIVRLAKLLSHYKVRNWTVKDVPVVSDGEHILTHRSPLPFSMLPRTIPRSTLPQVSSLSLSGLSLKSTRNMMRVVGNQISCKDLELDSVVFAEKGVGRVQQGRLASRTTLERILLSHGLQNRDVVQHWMKTSNTIFASQGHRRLDDIFLTLVESYLNLLISHLDSDSDSNHPDHARHLQVHKISRDNGGTHFYSLSERRL